MMGRPDTDAFMEGYLAAEAGKPRECINPWNIQWQREWLRGYNEYCEAIENQRAAAERGDET